MYWQCDIHVRCAPLLTAWDIALGSARSVNAPLIYIVRIHFCRERIRSRWTSEQACMSACCAVSRRNLIGDGQKHNILRLDNPLMAKTRTRDVNQRPAALRVADTCRIYLNRGALVSAKTVSLFNNQNSVGLVPSLSIKTVVNGRLWLIMVVNTEQIKESHETWSFSSTATKPIQLECDMFVVTMT
jgi:hypothetical protein